MPQALEPVIVWSHLPPSPAVEDAIRRRVGHLHQLCTDLHSCRVVIEQLQRRSQQGRPFELRVELSINGPRQMTARSHHEDVYVALREAFEDISRKLHTALSRRRDGAAHRESIRRLAWPVDEGSPSATAPGPTADVGPSRKPRPTRNA